MWKSFITRLVQVKSLPTSSHTLTYNKEVVALQTRLVSHRPKSKEQKYVNSSRNNKKSGDHWKKYSPESESRHNSFDPFYGSSDFPEEHGRVYNDKHVSGKRNRESQEKRDTNANLVEIGSSNKWNVGAGFAKEADRLRNKVKTYSDFKQNGRHSIKQDPGIRRQARAMKNHINENEFFHEELNEEVDAMKFDKLYDSHQENKKNIDELVKLKIVKQKYFKETKQNMLSWSDKEHIRYLHNTDPQQWTYEVIAEKFHIDLDVAKAVAKANWIPKKPKNINETSSTSIESYPPALVDGRLESNLPSSSSKQRMTWRQLRDAMGETEDNVNKVAEHGKKIVESETDQDLVKQYICGEIPKWSSEKSDQPQLTLEGSGNNVNVYCYDHKHGYQVFFIFIKKDLYSINLVVY